MHRPPTTHLAPSALIPVPSHLCALTFGFRRASSTFGCLHSTRAIAAMARFLAARRIDTRFPEAVPSHLAMSGQFHTYGRRTRDIRGGSAA
jgi:hypothetical protein